jgi:hypothetical protein
MGADSHTPAGLILPTMRSFTPGAGNPRDSAMLAQQNMNAKQASLNASVGGRRRRKKRGLRYYSGGDSNDKVNVPQFSMLYTPQGGVGTNPNDQIKAGSSTSMQSTSNAHYDKFATKMGGTKKRHRSNKKGYMKIKRTLRNKKGGSWNPNWSWGCYSGGRKTRRTRSNKKRRM